MATLSLGRLTVHIGADTRELERGVKRSKKSVDALGGAMKRALAVGAGAFAVDRLTSKMRSAAASFDNVAKTADKLGVTTDYLQEMRVAAELTGVKVTALDMGMQRFTRRAAEAAAGTGEAKDALEAMGIKLTDNEGKVRKTEDLLNDVAAALQKVPDQATRVKLAFKLFDSEGVALVNTLGRGKDALEAYRKKARDTGLVVEESMLRKSEKLNDELALATEVIDTNLNKAFVQLAPVLRDVSQLVAQFAGWLAQGVTTAKQLIGIQQGRHYLELKARLEEVNSELETWTQRMAMAEQQTGMPAELGAMSKRQVIHFQRLTKESKDLQAEIDKLEPKMRRIFGLGDTDKPDLADTSGTVPLIDPKAEREKDKAAKRDAERRAAEEEARMEALEYQFEMLNENLLREEEAINLSYERRLEALHAAKQEQLDGLVNYAELEKRIEEEKEAALTDLAKREAEERKRMMERNIELIRGGLSDLGGVLEAFGVRSHAVRKAFAISDALISTYQAVAKAQSAAPPPLSYVLMAIAAARGLAQVIAIARTPAKSKGAGGGAAAGGGGAAAAGAASAKAGPQTGNTLTVEPLDPNAIFSGASVAGLAERLIEFQKDGGKVVYAG